MDENEKKTVQTMYESNKYSVYSRPFYYLIIALFILYGGIKSFFDISQMEKTGTVTLKNSIQSMLYDLAGKWGILAITIIAAAVLLYRMWVHIKIIRSSLKK